MMFLAVWSKVCNPPTITEKSSRNASFSSRSAASYNHFKHGMDYCRLAYLNEKLERIYKKNPELPKINVHAFRHTHASLLFAAGASIKDVQARLGHTDIQTTMDIYTHVTDEAKEKTAEMFQKYMSF